jgi:cobalt/nickel-transporting P-type ATPase D
MTSIVTDRCCDFFCPCLFLSAYFVKFHEGSPNKLHPYEEEITNLLHNPQVLSNFVSDCGNAPLDMSCSYTWIDTDPQLESLAGLLSRENFFAVDTEQHSFRSFLGYTALMQVMKK